jgi:hypothetical protein
MAKQSILALLTDMQIIDAPHNVVINALSSNRQDIEDALQYYTALHYKLDAFILGDKKFMKSATPSLPVCHPAEFIKHFFKKYLAGIYECNR